MKEEAGKKIHLLKKRKKEKIMHVTKETKKIAISFLIVILIIIGGNYYLFTQIKTLSGNLENMRVESENEFTLMKGMLSNMQGDYQKKVDALKNAIEKIEKESDVKIGELEEELKNVNIKSGDFSAVLNDVFQGVVSVVTDRGQGSGAIITDDGYIITNYHVVQGASVIRVVDYSKNIYAAAINGSDAKLDIAVLKISSNEELKRLTFTDSSKVKVGEKVVAVGNPAGLGFTATEGIVSQVNRFATKNNPEGLMQVDIPINPGNSGGPVINIQGNIVGITQAKLAGYEGLGFAISANAAKTAAEQIIGKDF